MTADYILFGPITVYETVRHIFVLLFLLCYSTCFFDPDAPSDVLSQIFSQQLFENIFYLLSFYLTKSLIAFRVNLAMTKTQKLLSSTKLTSFF